MLRGTSVLWDLQQELLTLCKRCTFSTLTIIAILLIIMLSVYIYVTQWLRTYGCCCRCVYFSNMSPTATYCYYGNNNKKMTIYKEQ